MAELEITGISDDEFSFDPAPTQNAMGGTELMMKWLRENVDHSLLDHFQIIPTRVRALEDKPRVLWTHDTADDPECRHLAQPENREKFAKMVCVSDWQKEHFQRHLGIPPSFISVMKNAIYPIDLTGVDKPTDKIKLIYHTTPHRGLGILFHVFRKLAEQYDDIELDVYSSFKIYGWEQRDKEFEDLFNACKEHPRINYYGTVSNDEVREALKRAHVFAYPSIWPETSCISLIEAMSAKCYCVYPNFAALPETGAGFGLCYPYHEDVNEHVRTFYHALDAILINIRNGRIHPNYYELQKVYFDTMYGWNNRARDWESFLRYMIEKEKHENA